MKLEIELHKPNCLVSCWWYFFYCKRLWTIRLLKVLRISFYKYEEDMQKIVDANEKLVKELEDGTNTISE